MSRLQASLDLLRALQHDHGAKKILVANSGGKDSIVTLDLCVRAFGAENVSTFHMELVPGLESVRAPALAIAKRYGVKVHLVPHWKLTEWLHNAMLMPHIDRAIATPKLKLGDVENIARKKAGIDWIAAGWRLNDSITRRVALKRWGYTWTPSGRIFPIAEWTTNEVIGWIKAQRIPIPPRFGNDNVNVPSGFDFSPACLKYLRDRHPADWSRLLKVFPFSEAILKREEFYGKPVGST